jgi:hypothetical protein
VFSFSAKCFRNIGLSAQILELALPSLFLFDDLVGDPNNATSRARTRIARLLGLVVAALAQVVGAGVGYDRALLGERSEHKSAQ